MTALPILQPRRTSLIGLLLRLYRLAIILGIAWLIREHATRIRIDADAPIRVDEARIFFPGAQSLQTDLSDRQGLLVLDRNGTQIGYVLKTSPMCDSITGYSGPTDTLIALDAQMKVVGIRIRSSADTKQHVGDVCNDEYFLSLWNDKTWDQVAGMEPQAAHIEGVSGASLTSLCIANSIHQRFKTVKEGAVSQPPVRIGAGDLGLAVVIVVALLFAFTSLRGRIWFRRMFQLVLIGYVGFYSGNLISQSQLAGWTAAGISWRLAPGLALLTAAALIVPWTSRRALYCSQICPHGAAQELLGRLLPNRLRVPVAIDRALRWLPPLLVALVIAITTLNLPLDLAGIEPFDAYLVRTAGRATIAIAVAGLAASLFVPMAYCKYGCPTGAMLSFVRAHGIADRFSRRDVAAGALLLFTWLLCRFAYAPVHAWILQ